MLLFKTAGDVLEFSLLQQNQQKSIGFVPTMGALHDGHLALIEASKMSNDLTVCSIFVNPTQFNNPDDFKHYPITIEKDIKALEAAGADMLFYPSVAEIYPAGWQKKHYDLGYLETILEGAFRPGHFQGVCEVVERLLDIVMPANLYMGQKDFQQCMVIKRLLSITGKDQSVKLHIIPTYRETDGLAMSSRNMRLNDAHRQLAVEISKALETVKQGYGKHPGGELTAAAKKHLEQKGFGVDYVEIASAEELLPVTGTKEKAVVLAAASLGSVRLIDNLLLN